MKTPSLLLLFLTLVSLTLCACRAEPAVTPGTDTPPAETTVPFTEPVTEPATVPFTAPFIEPVTEPTTEPAPEYPLSDSLLPQVYIYTENTITRSKYVSCSVTVRDPSGAYEEIADPEATVKVRGNSTSRGEKKPYNIKFSSKVELLGLGKGKKWSLLANLYDKTQLRNALAFSFAQEAGVRYVSDSCFAEVYLNGTYCGLYQITEPVDVSKTQVDIDTDSNEFLLELEPRAGYSNPVSLTLPVSGIILGYNEPEEPTPEQKAWLTAFMNDVEAALLSGDFAKVTAVMDVDSFARNYIVQELFKNADCNVSSTRFFVKEGKLYEGPIWDFDLSSGNCVTWYYKEYNNTETSGLSYEGLWAVGNFNRYLFDYPEFTAMVKSLLEELQPQIRNLYEKGGKIDRLLSDIREDIDRNNTLWKTDVAYGDYEHRPVDGTYDGEIAYLRNWLEQRNRWLYEYYCTDPQ